MVFRATALLGGNCAGFPALVLLSPCFVSSIFFFFFGVLSNYLSQLASKKTSVCFSAI
jgi:hypothetical protein